MPLQRTPKTIQLESQAKQGALNLGMPDAALTKALAERDYFAVLEWLIPRRGKLDAQSVATLRETLEELLRIKAFAHPATVHAGKPVPVVFGTAGHRGEIGLGLGLFHIHVIITAFIQMLEDMPLPERAKMFGAADLDHVKQMGMLIGHDNRLFNQDFSGYAGHLLANAGYRVCYAGRAATPELSRVVPYQGWAGAVNFTPSHNPFRYGGIKLNPADGGLAGPEFTDPLAHLANKLMGELHAKTWPDYDTLDAVVSDRLAQMEQVDIHTAYLESLEKHPIIRLNELCDTLRDLGARNQFHWVADPTWGASVPTYQRLQQRLGTPALTLIHTEEDPYFGGQTTEPNEDTLADALNLLRKSKALYKIAIRNDPDSDRGIVGDDQGAIKMNRFAPLVMRYLMDLGQEGALVTTHPTSHFGPDYARAHGRHVHLTPTGFKNFVNLLQDGTALVAYEESDGISIHGHTLDKDGILAGLLAARIVLHYQKSLSSLLAEMEDQYGRYYWLQDTFPIAIPAAEAKVRLKKLGQAYAAGKTVTAGGVSRTIAQVNTEDGYKFTFEDGTWLMMRPSGTEPKVRVYAETREGLEQTRALCGLGRDMALGVINQG